MFVLLWALAGADLTVAARVEAARAVERARYAFVIGATRPFDEAYPAAVFARRVAREQVEESLLAGFGLRPSPDVLAREFARIEKDTRAPEQWLAVKAALGNDRRLIEEAVCRPLLVRRALEARFAIDAHVHAAARAKARAARVRWLAGEPSPAAVIMVIDRRDPAAPAVLERQLRRPGDVSTILEHRDRFDVYRLLAITREAWKVEAVRVPKADFHRWLEGATTRAAFTGPR